MKKELDKKLFPVEPLPDGAKLIYDYSPEELEFEENEE